MEIAWKLEKLQEKCINTRTRWRFEFLFLYFSFFLLILLLVPGAFSTLVFKMNSVIYSVTCGKRKTEGMNRKADALGTKDCGFNNSSSDPQRLLPRKLTWKPTVGDCPLKRGSFVVSC